MNSPDIKRQSIEDHFILPVQRITRYGMLLNDLLKHSDVDHVDYSDLQLSCEMMKTLVLKINEAKRKEEQFTRLFQIQKEVENCPPTVVSATRVYHSDLNFLEFDHVTYTPLPAARLFLFSDVLMIAKYSTVQWVSKIKEKKACKFYKLIELKNLTIESIDEKELKNLIRITEKTSKAQYCYQAAYAKQRQEFCDAINDAISALNPSN